MADGGITATQALIATTVVSTTAATATGVQSARAQRRAQRLEQKRQRLEQARERRSAVREARIALGQSVNNAAGQGATTSSAAQGAQGDIKSQTNYNLSFLDKTGRLAEQGSEALSDARNLQAYSSAFQSIASASSSLIPYSSEVGSSFNKIFGRS